MRRRVFLGTLAAVAFLGLVPASRAALDARVATLLACPVKVTTLVAVYGPAGAKYKAADYAHINPSGTEKLWVYGVFKNEGEDPVTSFKFEVRVWDAAGAELFREEEIFDLPLRTGEARGKEWSWVFDGAEAATVIFIPRIINYPGTRTWEADEKYLDTKINEVRGSD